MKPARQFADAAALRQALEARLNEQARRESVDVQRLRRQVAFDRLLSRLFAEGSARWALKGGYAMELRIASARATRDVDLAFRPHLRTTGKTLNLRILEMLQADAARDLGDAFAFAIGEPMSDLAGAPYGGARYPVECRMAGRVFARFHLDVGSGDAIIEPLEEVRGHDWLDFAGIAPAVCHAIPQEQQFAEKLHAYTLPRTTRPNSRVRDLVDMVLLVRGGLDTDRVITALEKTFDRRKSHDIPAQMAPPPANWAGPYAELAGECRLPTDIAAGFRVVEGFFTSLPLRGKTTPAARPPPPS